MLRDKASVLLQAAVNAEAGWLLADHADTLIGEAVLMVSANMTLEQVGNAIHPHPTQTELFGELARRLGSRLRRSAKMKAK